MRSQGFTLIQVVVVFPLLLIMTSVPFVLENALPDLRLQTDARAIASQLVLARTRAASELTPVRLACGLRAGACQVESENSGAFRAEGGTFNLSPKISFGYGGISIAAGSATSIVQTPQITFNSHSVPVDSHGLPTGNNALYLTDNKGRYYAVTVSQAGRVSTWRWNHANWAAE